MYRLIDSMIDRINFDEAMRQEAYEAIATMDGDYLKSETPERIAGVYWQQFQETDVDDIEEAKARFLDVWQHEIRLARETI
jgi:hypothetical protein